MITRDEAWELLTKYNKEQFHLRHALTVEGIMRYFAKDLGYENEIDFWGVVGLLHDIHFEEYPTENDAQAQELLRQHNVEDTSIHDTESHSYGLTYANRKK